MQHEGAVRKQHDGSARPSQKATALDLLSVPGDFHAEQHALKHPTRETMTPSAMLHLQRSIGNRAVQRLLTGANGTPALQRASAYDGVMPAHDVYGDSYAFNGGTSDKFTYHHIIPENKLDLVTKALEGIKKYFAKLEKKEDNKALRGEGDTLNTETQTLVTGAQAGWLNTRVTNLTFFLNKEYAGDGFTVTESEVRNILANTDPDLPTLFKKFKILMQQKVKNPREGAYGMVTEALKPEGLQSLYYALFKRDRAKVKEKLETLFKDRLLDFDMMTDEIMAYLKTIPKRLRGERLNKTNLRAAIYDSMEPSFESHFATKYPFIVQDATTNGTMKAVLQKYAMPHGQEKHLEHAIQWNPGNIHRGPSSSYRLNPEDKVNFDELLDDGGDTFEKAAQKLVKEGHFEVLEKLNGDIDMFIAIPWVANAVAEKVEDDEEAEPAPELDMGTVQAATAIVKQMQGLQKFGTTKFDESKWEEKKINGKSKMRFKAPPVEVAVL